MASAIPARTVKITFLPMSRTVVVEPATLTRPHRGLPGSVLDIALRHDIEIDHACGGSCACSTCHVIVRSGLASCNGASEKEEDRLDSAYGLTPQSRLSCQCVPNGSEDLVVEIPSLNRNLVRE